MEKIIGIYKITRPTGWKQEKKYQKIIEDVN